ncbi:MAG: lytic transglycosylase domain-containing protein, partial [Sphingomonas sp.]
AQGLAQLMPGTAAALGVDDVFDPDRNIDGGARYLAAMLARFGSVPLGLAAYNAGPGRVSAAGGIPANRETPGYVRRVMDFWNAGTHATLGSVRAAAVALGFDARSRE